MKDTILEILPGKSAHVTFEQAVEGTDTQRINETGEGIPHSLWDLVEHIRRAQRDILEFIQEEDYVHPEWPDDYWPDGEGDRSDWYDSIRSYQDDRQSLIQLTYKADLTQELPHQPGYTYLREILLVAQHTSYHVGQIVTLRRTLGDWGRK